MTYHKYSIGISSIFDTVLRYLPIFLTVLWYWLPPNVPLLKESQGNVTPVKTSAAPIRIE